MSGQTESKAKKPVWQEVPFLVGIGLTLLVSITFGFSLFCLPTASPIGHFESKWHYLIQATPNEIGDTLAGFAGSLAFVWLVVTVWLQATELREQRDEFERMADAQQKQVELLVKQGAIFEQEQKVRDADLTWNAIEERIQLLVFRIEAIPMPCRSWTYTPKPPKGMDRRPSESWFEKNTRREILFEEFESSISSVVKLAKWSRDIHFRVQRLLELLDLQEREIGHLGKATRYTGYGSIADLIDEIIQLQSTLVSDSYQLRLRSLGLDTMNHNLKTVLANDSF